MRRWRGHGGYGQVLTIGLPLVASMGSTTVMQFTDRVFLSNYSLSAISAALPAGVAFFLFLAFFMGTVNYVGVFVAQYTGAGRHERVGAALWQGIWFCALSGLVLVALSFLAGPLFSIGGHPDEVRELEEIYFTILMRGGVLAALGVCLSCFYTGRGMTRVVMFVNMIGALLNIPLDYCLINGVWIFPEMGIRGAALATAWAWAFMALFYAALIFGGRRNRAFNVRGGLRPDKELFRRLMKFGLPGGVEFFLDIFAVTVFVFMVGRLGEVQMAASNIALSIHSLAFLPMIGLSVATSTLVGQALGRDKPDEADRAKGSAMHLTLAYTGVAAVCFVLFPESLISLFRPQDVTNEQFAAILHIGPDLLALLAVLCIIDATVLINFGALKGAGDSRFLMNAMAVLSILGMIVPVSVAMFWLGWGLNALWFLFVCYIALLAVVMQWRYRGGKWRSMRVIEEDPKTAG